MIRRLIPLILLVAAAACNKTATSPTSSAPFSSTDLVVGTGALASTGNRVTVAYTGFLYDSSKPNGKGTQFDTSSGFSFTLGAGQVIKGWDQGVAGMRVGGQRRLVIPPELGYGSTGAGGGVIPPNATLVFDITMNAVQ